MVRYEKLSATENAYPFIDASVAADYVNGTFGAVSNDVFTAGEGFMAIMQVETGDDAYTDNFTITTAERARIADFTKSNGQIVNITSANLPASFAVADKLIADATGKLKVEASPTGNYFKVIEKTRYGARAEVVIAVEEFDPSDYVSADMLGVANGVATLGADGKLTTAQRPE